MGTQAVLLFIVMETKLKISKELVDFFWLDFMLKGQIKVGSKSPFEGTAFLMVNPKWKLLITSQVSEIFEKIKVYPQKKSNINSFNYVFGLEWTKL